MSLGEMASVASWRAEQKGPVSAYRLRRPAALSLATRKDLGLRQQLSPAEPTEVLPVGKDMI